MKRYLVDVSGLTAEEKILVKEKLDMFSFMVTTVIGNDRKVSAFEVFWGSSEDFMASPIFPSGCPCKEI